MAAIQSLPAYFAPRSSSSANSSARRFVSPKDSGGKVGWLSSYHQQ
jgi:hypothetical protein